MGEELSRLQARVVQTAVYVDRQTGDMGSFKETPVLCPGNQFKGLSVEFPFCCFFFFPHVLRNYEAKKSFVLLGVDGQKF